ncbi:MAG: hypothetical protein PHS02_01430 [Candidatus ainarchaeum sp.]|nr:hypothetical protein [Candidatus ainarchaeum sp.]
MPEYLGFDRLALELENKPLELFCFKQLYLLRVRGLKQKIGVDSSTEEDIFNKIWHETNKNKMIADNIESDFLNIALSTGKWDCDNMSLLIFDVLNDLGLKPRIVLGQGHVYVCSGSRYYETTNGYHDSSRLLYNKNKNIVYYEGSDREAIKAITHKMLAEHNKDINRELALYHISKAITLIPEYATAFFLRGLLYECLGKLDEGTADIEKAKTIDPSYEEAQKTVSLDEELRKLLKGDLNG